ncbi:MAG: agmatine deiminase family protein [Bryobacteraceae bacterium]|nr:agmatine deiminase family protein [Bryobacteraceae bacterium]MDW8378489.1 agmatine deiminase family protein [Bryobacterales bacterium]
MHQFRWRGGRLLGSLIALVAASLLFQCARNKGVSFQLVPLSEQYRGAVSSGVLRWACAPEKQQIQVYFAQKSLPFWPEIVRQREGSFCHILYEPSLPGFQAAAEDEPVNSIYFNIDALAFFAGRRESIGDSLDVAATILAHSPRALDVILALNALPSEELFRNAVQRLIPASAPHRIQAHPASLAQAQAPWMQDFLKPGHQRGEPRILVTRRAFEGTSAHAEKLDPVLDSFRPPLFHRSQLSWEGGDLQFVRHPAARDKVVMFYGTSMKTYWAESLTRHELEYILRLEFGADEAVYLGDVTPHVDYLMSLLPNRATALVAKPVCGDLRVARAAVDLLLEHHAPAPPQELQQLSALIPRQGFLAQPPPELDQALAQAFHASREWRPARDPAAEQRIRSFVEEHCPGDPGACLAPQRLPHLLTEHTKLLREWVEIGARIRLAQLLNERMLELVESQTRDCSDLMAKADAAAQQLSRMGFHLVRIPWLPPSARKRLEWAGISYANAARVDETLFVPAFGLEPLEKEWFAQLRHELPEGYRLVAVPARFLLLENGGLHCAMAVVRRLGDRSGETAPAAAR